MRSAKQGAGRRAAGTVTLLGIALTVVVTWPAVLTLDSHTLHSLKDPDLQVCLWWSQAFEQSILSLQNPFFRDELVWPDGLDVRLMIWNVGIQLLFLPITAATSPLVGLNLTALCMVWLNGVSCAWAGWTLTRSRLASLAAMAVGCTAMYAFAEAAAGKGEQAFWAPAVLYLTALITLRKQPGRRWALGLAAGSLAVAGACYWIYAYFLVLITVVAACVWLVSRQMSRRNALDLMWIGGLSALLASPFLLPIATALLQSDNMYDTTLHVVGTPDMQLRGSLGFPESYLGVFGRGSRDLGSRFPLLFVPVVAWALYKGRGWVRFAAVVAAVTAVLAAGPVLVDSQGQPITVLGHSIPLPAVCLHEALPGFQRMWWPYRWLGPSLAAFSLVVAWGVTQFRHRRIVVASLIGFMTLEGSLILHQGGGGWNPFMRTPIPDVLTALAEEPGQHPVWVLPTGDVINGGIGWQPFHQQPIDGAMLWHMGPQLRGEAYESRRHQVELLNHLAVPLGEPPLEPGPWAEKRTGGFHYVLLESIYGQPDAAEYWTILCHALGPPFYVGDQLSLWAVPGLVPVPSGFSLLGDQCPP